MLVHKLIRLFLEVYHFSQRRDSPEVFMMILRLFLSKRVPKLNRVYSKSLYFINQTPHYEILIIN